MKKLIPLLLGLIFLVGCSSSPSSRISKNQALYDSYPAEVQQKIANGQVDIGFDKDQVLIALGEPDDTVSRKTASGESEVWLYRKKKSPVSLGLGLGFGSGGVGTGVGVSTSTGRGGVLHHIVFVGGKVTQVEGSE